MSTSQADQAMQTFKARQRRKAIKRWITIGIILLFLGGGAFYFLRKDEAQPQTIIRYTTIERGDIMKSITATGTLQATTTVQVGTQVSGTVKELHADFNSKVKKGDLIAVIDPTFYEAAIKQSQANYQKALADKEKSQKDADRAEALFKQDLLSKAEHDAAVSTLAQSTATVSQAEAALEQAKVNLGYTQIHAPISGTIVSRNVDVGQTVAASLNAPVIFVIAQDLSKMQVQASVDEADIGGVKVGQEVQFTVDAFGDEKFYGTVNSVRLNATITQNVVNYTVVIDADNSDLKLLPSMTATVTIINSSKKDVLKVPLTALRFTPPNMDRGKGGDKSHRGAGGAQRSGGNQGAGAEHKMMQEAASDSVTGHGTIYIKAPSTTEDKTPRFQAVPVTTGISDGIFVEINPINYDLKPTDSIAVGMYSVGGGSSSSPAPGTSPFGSPGNSRGVRRM